MDELSIINKNDENNEPDKKKDIEFKKYRKRMYKLGLIPDKFERFSKRLRASRLFPLFHKLGYEFDRWSRNITVQKYGLFIDILMENGEVAIAVEVKSSMKEKYLDEFFKKMEILRQYADRKQDKRKYLGAIAAAIINDEQRQQILNEGIYLIEQTGDTMMINIPEGFKPREW